MIVITAIAFGLLGAQANSAVVADALQRLRPRVSVSPVQGTVATLAGRYANPPKALTRSWGGGELSGNDLYLFPDGTYLYCEWADIEPATVYDKGTWRVSGALLELASDTDIKWDPSAERQYVIVHRNRNADEVLLIGIERSLSYFEAEVRRNENAETLLLVVAHARDEAYDKAGAAKTKAELLEDAWRPEYFLLSAGTVHCTIAPDERGSVRVALENSSSIDVDATISAWLTLESSVPQQVEYWAPVDLDSGLTRSENSTTRLTVRAGPSVYQLLLTRLLWERNVSTVWPSRDLKTVVLPDRYHLSLSIEGLVRGDIVTSNLLDAQVDENGVTFLVAPQR